MNILNNLLAVADEGGNGGGGVFNQPALPGQISNPAVGTLGVNKGLDFLGSAIPAVITIAMVVGVLVFVFILIMGAIQWISSGGDKQGLEAARGKITNAFVGLVILFAVFAIIKLIEIFFGIHVLSLTIPNLI
jgi:hypothetical protein